MCTQALRIATDGCLVSAVDEFKALFSTNFSFSSQFFKFLPEEGNSSISEHISRGIFQRKNANQTCVRHYCIVESNKCFLICIISLSGNLLSSEKLTLFVLTQIKNKQYKKALKKLIYLKGHYFKNIISKSLISDGIRTTVSKNKCSCFTQSFLFFIVVIYFGEVILDHSITYIWELIMMNFFN